MKKHIFLLTLFLFGLILSIKSQSASDYFHSAANHYINSEKGMALKTIQEGISKFPNDIKLKDLENKINKLPDDNTDRNKPDQQNKKPQPQPQQPQMSKENAQQILDALQQDEKDTKEKAEKARVRGIKRAEKDW